MRFIKNIRIIFWLLTCTAFSFSSCSEEKKEKEYVDIMKSEALSDKALGKSWDLMKQGQQLVNEGESIDDIVKTFPEGTIFQTNSNSIMFFIEGSIPMVIEFDKNNITKGGGNYKGKPLQVQISPPLSLNTNFSSTTYFNKIEELVDVVASEKNDDERQKKKALILAPYNATDFKNRDDADIAFKYLKKNRNYKDHIVFLKNELTMKDFLDFEKYDLVHLSTHGKVFCNPEKYIKEGKVEIISGGDSNFCKTIISTNIKHGIKFEGNVQQLKNKILEKYGNNLDGLISFNTKTIYLKGSFFGEIYQDLDDKIWIFSSCETGIRSELSESMKRIHTNGHFFTWLYSVRVSDSYRAFNKFYEKLINNGLDAQKSFKKIPSNLREGLKSSLPNSTIKIDTELLHLQTGDPRHGIEIIDMLNPENKSLVQEGDFYPLAGDFDDGKDEALTLKVKLIGYTKAEFLEKQMSISLEVDEVSVLNKKPFLPDVKDDNITVELLEDHEFGVIVTIKDIAIKDVGTKKKLTLKALLHLNNENYSIHKEQVSIVANGIIATMKSSGAVMKYIYDDKTKAVKVNAMGNLMYYDNEGYTYMKTPFHGWQKMNASELTTGFIQGKNEAQSWGLDIPMPSNTELNEIAKANTKLPAFIDFAINWRAKSFESSKEFNKTTIKYDSKEDCSKFIGPKGMTVIFSPSGKLLEFSFGNKFKLEYEYGNYNVTLPKATKMDFMACMQHNH
ncbi:MAG: hypothetical protein L3J14_05580 [Flavobacteriaceae bacterium]|nr:hypothetical protein [Flavobacteriaceae bacterium]